MDAKEIAERWVNNSTCPSPTCPICADHKTVGRAYLRLLAATRNALIEIAHPIECECSRTTHCSRCVTLEELHNATGGA